MSVCLDEAMRMMRIGTYRVPFADTEYGKVISKELDYRQKKPVERVRVVEKYGKQRVLCFCKTCDRLLTDETVDYCPGCGQAIDWEEVEV